MTIVERIEQDLRTAMKAKNSDEVRTLRLAMSSIKYVVKESRKDLDDTGVIAVLQKEIKIRNETMDEAKKGGRQDLIDENMMEINILKRYLPAPLTDEELEALVQDLIKETGAETMKDMGRVMKPAIEKVAGRATNSAVSQAIRKYLAG